MRSAFRIAFAVLTAALLFGWFAAREAHAAAPQCDERGATTFAKNPLLEIANQSIDIGEDCSIPVPGVDDSNYEEGRGSVPDFGGSVPQSIVPSHIVNIAPPSALVPWTPTTDLRGPVGVLSTVDRPPRS
jgi:hypothetical protein